MNNKIFNELQNIFNLSPQLLSDSHALSQAISITFDVELTDVSYDCINELVDKIDRAVLERYFSKVWQPQTKKYKYSGLAIIDEVNNLSPRRVLDAGCGYNEFKGKINNLTGVDPYNPRADVCSYITDYKTDEKFDVVICLGSINFGTVDKIFKELKHVVDLTHPGGLLYFRVNPGQQHTAPESRWIDFFDWQPHFIFNAAATLNCSVINFKQDADRYYFVLKKNKPIF